MSSDRAKTQEIVIGTDVLAPENGILAELVDNRRALFVVTSSVYRLYGSALRRSVASRFADSQIVVLDRCENDKTLDAVAEVCDHASRFGLEREAPIVAIGGGVCLDICGLSAAIYRRGVPNIKVPTTLVGLVDAGVGTKNAVNHNRHKSLLGTFHPPEASLLDIRFLATLPDRHIRNGVAEMLKVAIIADRPLFDLLRGHGYRLVREKFQGMDELAAEAIRRSLVETLSELSLNLYEENTPQRKLDFGHTFSPYVETASDHTILHGEAVAIDIAISIELAWGLGILSTDDREALLVTMSALGLPIYWEGIDVAHMHASLRSIQEHRNGNLHLAVPSTIGDGVFLGSPDVDVRLLEECVARLAARAAGAGAASPRGLETRSTS